MLQLFHVLLVSGCRFDLIRLEGAISKRIALHRPTPCLTALQDIQLPVKRGVLVTESSHIYVLGLIASCRYNNIIHVVHIAGIVVICDHILIEKLLNVGLARILYTADWTFNI